MERKFKVVELKEIERRSTDDDSTSYVVKLEEMGETRKEWQDSIVMKSNAPIPLELNDEVMLKKMKGQQTLVKKKAKPKKGGKS